MAQTQKIIEALLTMNMDVLAAKVRLGATVDRAAQFMLSDTEQFVLRKMFEQVK